MQGQLDERHPGAGEQCADDHWPARDDEPEHDRQRRAALRQIVGPPRNRDRTSHRHLTNRVDSWPGNRSARWTWAPPGAFGSRPNSTPPSADGTGVVITAA